MKLIVDNGRVNCPRRGDLDIDYCAGCPDLLDVRRDGDDMVLVCRPPSNERYLDVRLMIGL